MSHEGRPKHVVVVGAGYTGLTAAYRLLRAGHRVTVLERSHRLGGLAMTYDLLGSRIEKYYHHLFTSDRDILALARELGVAVRWPSPPMGMFHGGRVYPFTTPIDLLRFRPLSLPDRVRFGAVALFLQHYPDARRFENVTAAEWYRRWIGPKAFEATVGPLLRVKFGRNAENVSMVWMWGKMRLRGTSRKQAGTKESLGYVEGSFGALTDKLESEIRKLGGEIRTGHVVSRIVTGPPSPELRGAGLPGFLSNLRPSENHASPPDRWLRVRPRELRVRTNRGEFVCDAVLSTVAPALLAEWAEELPPDWKSKARSIEYTGVLCTTLVLKRSLSPIYWMNVADPSVPFGGVIEHTNYIPAAEYGGRHIVYLSHYTYTDEEYYRLPSDEILRRYLPHLARIQPAFDPSWIEKVVFARDRYTQPIVGVRFFEKLLPYVTPLPGLFSASMAQIYPEDRGTNYAVRSGNQVARVIDRFLREAS
ncbi:MAG: oxidoreductase [Candidatus Binatia bacterium]|nr:MAG: oxidoreductase [Candidatus Binatia bacterium]